jgi:hypothetical protein
MRRPGDRRQRLVLLHPGGRRRDPALPGTKFAGGKAATVAFSVACGQIFCSTDFDQRTVQLKGK